MKNAYGKFAHSGEKGLALSDVVRETIDDRFEKVNRSKKVRDVKDIIQHIFEQYPDPAGLSPRTYDVRDRKAGPQCDPPSVTAPVRHSRINTH